MLNWNRILQLCKDGNLTPPHQVSKTEAQWRLELPIDVFRVTRQAATERAFSSDLCGLFEPGVYHCACCDTPLFDAQEKFESGTGWPSFTQPLAAEVVGYHADHSHGMVRVEAVCNVCSAHLGHVFPDGPPPSGLRYCMNALALKKG